jgi:ankyrin repeat protein
MGLLTLSGCIAFDAHNSGLLPDRVMKMIYEDDYLTLMRMIRRDSSLLQRRDALGNSLLHLAARSAGHELVQLLIDEGAAIEACDAFGRTPLHNASSTFDRFKVATVLLDEGANPNATDTYGCTSLHLAADYDSDLTVAELLLRRGARVNIRNIDGMTPLHLAVIDGRKAMVAVLLAYGADVNQKDDLKGLTALEWAEREHFDDIVRFLKLRLNQ